MAKKVNKKSKPLRNVGRGVKMNVKPEAPKPVKKAKRVLSPEQIARMQAGRKKAKRDAEKALHIVKGSAIDVPAVDNGVRIIQISTVFDPNMSAGPTAPIKGGIWMFGLGSDNKVYYWSFNEGRWIQNWSPVRIVVTPNPAETLAGVDPLS